MPCREEKETTPESPQESRRPRRRRGHARLTYPRATQGPPPQRARGARQDSHSLAMVEPLWRHGLARQSPLFFVLLINYLSLLGAVGLSAPPRRPPESESEPAVASGAPVVASLHTRVLEGKLRNARQAGRQAAARIKFRCSAGAFDYLLSPWTTGVVAQLPGAAAMK